MKRFIEITDTKYKKNNHLIGQIAEHIENVIDKHGDHCYKVLRGDGEIMLIKEEHAISFYEDNILMLA